MVSHRFKILDRYITRSGDTLYRVANMYFLCWSIWPSIYRINETVLTNPWDIPSGVEIAIPDLNTKKIEHTASGDDYFTLAYQYYGSMDLFYYIQKENKHEIITQGSTVTIPALVRERDIRRAKELRDDRS